MRFADDLTPPTHTHTHNSLKKHTEQHERFPRVTDVPVWPPHRNQRESLFFSGGAGRRTDVVIVLVALFIAPVCVNKDL